MKALNWIGWITLAVAALILVFAGIFIIRGKGVFGFAHLVNYFHAANTFILLTIAIFLIGSRGAEGTGRAN